MMVKQLFFMIAMVLSVGLIAKTIKISDETIEEITPSNSPGIVFVQDISPDTLGIFYRFGLQEYKNSNFGLARDIFSAIANKTSVFPDCDYFLGRIHSEVTTLQDNTMASVYFLKAANNKKINIYRRQESYLALAKMSDNDDMELKYAKDSINLVNNEKSKKALVAIYKKKYEKTKDKKFLDSASILVQSLNDSLENNQIIPSNYEILGKQ